MFVTAAILFIVASVDTATISHTIGMCVAYAVCLALLTYIVVLSTWCVFRGALLGLRLKLGLGG